MINYLVGGFSYPSEKWWSGVKVSWDDFSFPTEWKVIKFHGSSHHQPDGNSWYILWDFAGWFHGNGPRFSMKKCMEKGGVRRSSSSKVWNFALQTTKKTMKISGNRGWMEVGSWMFKEDFSSGFTTTEGCGERRFTIMAASRSRMGSAMRWLDFLNGFVTNYNINIWGLVIGYQPIEKILIIIMIPNNGLVIIIIWY